MVKIYLLSYNPFFNDNGVGQGESPAFTLPEIKETPIAGVSFLFLQEFFNSLSVRIVEV